MTKPKTLSRERKEPHVENHPVALTPAEVMAYGERLAQRHGELDRLAEQLAQAKSANKAAREPIEAEIHHLADAVRSRREVRSVDVQWALDYIEGKALLYRLDTGEVVRERPLTDGERQRALTYDGAEPEP